MRTFSTKEFSKKVTVKDIKEYLENFIQELDSFDSDAEVNLSTSTYGMNFPMQYKYGGFIDLDPMNLDKYINID